MKERIYDIISEKLPVNSYDRAIVLFALISDKHYDTFISLYRTLNSILAFPEICSGFIYTGDNVEIHDYLQEIFDLLDGYIITYIHETENSWALKAIV